MKNQSPHRYRWEETDTWGFSHWMNRSFRLVRRVAWETVSVVVLVVDAGAILVILIPETMLHPTQNRYILHFRSDPPRQCDGACWCPFHSWFHKPPHGYEQSSRECRRTWWSEAFARGQYDPIFFDRREAASPTSSCLWYPVCVCS